METAPLETTQAWLKEPKMSYAGGEFIKGGAPLSLKNPANCRDLTKIYEADDRTLALASLSAQNAMRGAWAQITRRERAQALEAIGQLIRDHRSELAILETLANGKLYSESFNDDLPESADVFDYYAGWVDKYYSETCPVERGFLNYTVREPIGVCALIVPWNFPLLLACWKMAPALAMGNTVIVKPAPNTTLTLIRLAELIDTAKILPPGVFNLVLGGAEIGQKLCLDPRIQKVSFTGSSDVAKEVVKASVSQNLKSLTLELGGKSPNIIFADAKDLDWTVRQSFRASFSHKGEKCSEPTRFFVEAPVYKQVCEHMASLAHAVVCGDPFASLSTQGAQCNEAQFEKILRYIEIGKKESCRLLAGGERDRSPDCQDGYFIRPTLFADANNAMRVSQEEIFGPVVVLIPFHDDEEVLAMANQNRYGLAAGLWTRDLSRALRFCQGLESGMVFVNHYGCYDFSSPFGGIKDSGWGKEMGVHALAEYTKLKSVWFKI